MKQKWFLLSAVTLVAVVALFSAQDAQAAGAEDQIMGIVQRVLDMVANFLAQVFQSIADAIKSVWSPSQD